MKKVLIIAYYWPPSGGSGVQRWLKFVKYLPEFGWKPIVYTPENPDFSLHDETLLKEIPTEAEVIKQPIWEPYQLGRKLFGDKKRSTESTGIVSKKKGRLKSYIANWVRGNIFVPDPKVYWRNPSVRYLQEYLSNNPVDVIVSTGTPHSMHLIALDLKRKLGIPWLADFRDPWSELDMLKSYHILPFRMKKYQQLERSVLETADLSITTSKVWAKRFIELGAKRVETITNGYDLSDFKKEVVPYHDFVISHFGLLNHLRNPKFLWKALDELCEENEGFSKELKIHLGGTIAPENLEEIKRYKHLSEKLKVFPYLTHSEVIEEYQKSSLLLLLLFNSESGVGNIPGKIFEYLATAKPIIAFGPGVGDSEKIINDIEGNYYFDYNEEIATLKEAILEMYFSFKKGFSITTSQDVKQYSRKQLTKRLSQLMESIV